MGRDGEGPLKTRLPVGARLLVTGTGLIGQFYEGHSYSPRHGWWDFVNRD